MEIGRWLYYAVNCALLCYITAKPFSLNKLIEAEANQKEVVHTTLAPKIEEAEPAAERFSLNKGLKPLNRTPKNLRESEAKLNLIPLGKKISPLKYRKTFQIKSPLKPKRVKNSLRHKRKNQSIKREVDGNAVLNKKYVPLLRSLGMLFDNILGSDSSESYEKTKHKKRPRYYFDRDDDISCKCPQQREADSKPAPEETVTFSETLASGVAVTTEVATEATDNPSIGDISSFRHYTDIPLLLPRNTAGTRRNHNGVSERGRAAHNGSSERHLSGINGDSEYNTKHGQEQSYAESDEKYTDSYPRHDASRPQPRGAPRIIRGREHRNNTKEVYENYAISEDETENSLESREENTQYNGTYKLKIQRDKTKSGKLLSESIRKQRGFLSNDQVIDFTESVQSKENDKESIISITHHSSSSERFTNGNGAYSDEAKKVDSRTETVAHKVQVATKPYLAKFAKTPKIKIEHSDYLKSDQNDDYDESGINVSYVDIKLKSIETNYSSSKEARRTKTSLESMRHEPHISVELVQNKQREEKDGTMEYENTSDSDQFEGDNTFVTAKKIDDKLDLMHKADTSPEIKVTQHSPKSKSSKGPVVMIIDGYSVTRHKNGENKLAGKAIRIRP